MSAPVFLRLLSAVIASIALGGHFALAEDHAGAKVDAKVVIGLPAQELTEPVLYELLLGEIAAQRGSAALGARTFIDLARRTRDPRIAQRAVEIANRAKLPDVALEAAILWHQSDPASPQALRTVTAMMVGARRVQEAEPYLARLLASDETNTQGGFMQLGRLLAGNPDKAANLKVVRGLAETYPTLPEAHFAVSQAARSAGEDDLALEEIRKAAELRRDWEVAAVFESQLLQQKHPDQAAGRLESFLEKYPDKRDVRLNYARLLVTQKRFPEARSQFENLVAANPGNTDVVYAVGVLALRAKDYDIAEQNMTKLLTLGYRDTNGVRYIIGQIREEQSDWDGAIEWYRQVGKGEHFLTARLRTAQVMSKQGKLADAREYLQSVEASGEEQRVQLLVAEAQLLREANRAHEAYAFLSQALDKNPDQPELLYDHALTAEKLERFDVLEANLRKLIKVRPDHAHAYNALGYSLAERNERLDEAKTLIERALQLAPGDFFIVDSMGWLLFRQGKLDEALAELRRAYQGRPDAEIGAHLGEVLWTNGQTEEARRVWDEALKNHPANEMLLKTIKRFVQ